MAKLLVVSLITLAVVVGTYTTSVTKQEKNQKIVALEKSKERGKLAWYAEYAKAKGETRISKPAPLVEYVTEVTDINEVMSHYNLLVVQPVERRSYAQGDARIITWNKFKIIEDLSRSRIKQCSDCTIQGIAPAEMLPLQSDEILVPKYGGTITIDGVEITMVETDFPQFDPSKKYVLFLEADASGLWGRIMVGPGGVFTLHDNEKLIPINSREHSLKTIIQQDYDNSFSELKVKVKS
ncbi:MAG TPA: hypothetical protein VD835_09380 [Pyrinomonadaceae bacterium]|nr:hypothetical protein [Pyrinomonadaceae bacterium]